MTASSRGAQAFSALWKGQPQVHAQCVRGQSIPVSSCRRAYSAAATATQTAEPSTAPPDLLTSDPAPRKHNPPSIYRIKSGIILSRPPLLTRAPTPFEAAFYLYQKRLYERLTPFMHEPFYFKKDTPAAMDYAQRLRERRYTVARDIGVYHRRGRNRWNDEVRVGSELAHPRTIQAQFMREAVVRFSEDGEELAVKDRVPVERPRPRRTEADTKGDVRRLDRALDRTLYLVVRGRDGAWSFPAGYVPTHENLHEAAERVLAQAAGVNMNTWIVGRVPVAHLVEKPVLRDDSVVEKRGEKTFFLKGRIMAGQADLTNNALGLTDFKWLTREELERALAPEYFHRLRNMMADR